MNLTSDRSARTVTSRGSVWSTPSRSSANDTGLDVTPDWRSMSERASAALLSQSEENPVGREATKAEINLLLDQRVHEWATGLSLADLT